jgi:hypothetical protein
MSRLRAARLYLSAAAMLAVGLAGCTSDSVGPPPPPPPPPPPSAAEITIAGVVDPETGVDLPDRGDGIMVSGRIGVVIDFDPGSSELGSLDVILEDASGAADVIPCTDAVQGAVGLSADVQSVQCVIDTAEGAGACQGQAMSARFANGTYTVAAELTLQDGSTVSDEGDDPLLFDNGEATGGMVLDIGPRVVSVGDEAPEFGVEAGVPFWGGPRDLSWRACPVVFDAALMDICTVEISGGTLDGTGDLDLGNGPGQRAVSAAPFTYTAFYRDADGEPVNEDLVEDDPSGGGSVVGDGPTGFRVLLCDGTDVTEVFGMESDVRHLDTTAPSCDEGSCAPVIADMAVLQNGLYSDGDITLDGLTDGGVGGVYGVTAMVNAHDFDSGISANQELFLENTQGIADLPEDDGCGSDETTDGSVQFGCGGNEEGLPVDAYFLVVSEAADLLGNALGDGTMDRDIDDEFADSEEFGVDVTPPAFEEDEFEPPSDEPPFVWNPDLRNPATEPIGTGPFETLMFEADDPALASADPGSGLEDDNCLGISDPVVLADACDDVDGDENYIHGRLLAAPDPDDEFNPAQDDLGDAGVLPAFDAGLNMFEFELCQVLGAGMCDTSTDGTYTVEYVVSDHAVKENNVGSFEITIIVDVTPPEVTFDGVTGLDSSDAASVGLTLQGAVTDGTGVADAVVEVTVEDLDGVNIAASDGDCSTQGDALVNQEDNLVAPSDNDPDEAVELDITADVNASPDGSYAIDFTADNLGAGDYTYCFTVTADDGAERKDGSDDAVESVSISTKDFTWQ